MTSAALQSTESSFVDELQPGTELLMGQYKIKRYLNSGGFGITYLATDSLERPVVIKECFPRSFCRRSALIVQARSRAHTSELRSIVRLFTREAQALAKLDHPNIVGVHQVFEDNNTAYMALDFVEGHDLLAIIEKKVVMLRPDHVISILRKVLDAISCVHKEGLLHRDISPDNIIITSKMEPVLIDFGAAREQATKATRALSALRVVKDGYSPQEFYIAGSQQGPCSDLYSLAATFYHLITGELPPDSQVRIAAHVAKEPDPYVPLSKKTSQYDKSFCDALDKAMAILPKDRLQSAEDWLAILSGERKLGNFSKAVKPTKVTVGHSRQGKMIPLLVGGAAVAALAAGAVVVIPMLSQSETDTGAPGSTVASAPSAPETPPESPTAVPAQEVAVAETPAPVASQPVLATPSEAVSAPAAPSPLASFEQSRAGGRVSASWSVDLPFSVGEGGVVTAVGATSADWLQPGLRLVEVNGAPVSGNLEETVRDLALDGDGRLVELSLVAERGETGTRVFGVIDAPVAYDTRLANGLGFETRFDSGEWRTQVTSVPDALSGELREGDRLVALVESNERIASGEDLARIMAREIEAGTERLTLAVRRSGSMWVADVPVVADGS